MKVLTLNIHKGVSLLGNKVTVADLKRNIEKSGADIVCLQEVFKVAGPVLETLADSVWPHYAYGKNAVYTKGHHGNSILSRWPIHSFKNFDISNHPLERRGALWSKIIFPKKKEILNVVNVHLDLTSWGRKRQIEKVIKLCKKEIPKNEALILCGDFNDWPQELSKSLSEELNLREAYKETHGVYARTYPPFVPMFRLDRMYVRGLEIKEIHRLDHTSWHLLSDHLPLMGRFGWDV